MIGWFWRLIVGRFTPCHHRWAELERIEWLHRSRDTLMDRSHVLRCDHCGDMKSFRISR